MTVKQIQHLLAYLGLYTLNVDGVWGRGSEESCRKFQQQKGLMTDGIPGAETQRALRQAVAEEAASQEDSWAATPNFTRAEFACRCGCGEAQVDYRLVTICQQVRNHFDAPFDITSGCRCSSHNAAVKGVPNSRHLTGRAVDFSIRGRNASQVLAYVHTIPGIAYAYAIDQDHVHMDLV